MPNTHYQLLTPNNDVITLSSPAINAFDGGAGIDTLNIDWRNITDGIRASYLYPNGEEDWEGVSVYYDSFFLADMVYHHRYETYGQNTRVSYTNFEKVNVWGTAYNDVILYQNGTDYHGGAGVDDFCAFWGRWTEAVNWVNTGAPITLGTDNPVTISGMEGLGLYLGDSDDMIDNRAGSQSYLKGGGGNDKLYGSAENDVLFGETGNDELDGSAGADRMHGDAGDDTFWVDDGDDQVFEHSNQGEDTINTYLASYTLPENVERLYSQNNNENNVLTGNELDNLIFGSNKNDKLYGKSGNDKLYGNWGDDVLKGGAGDDLLVGGMGDDYMEGGAGDDTYSVDSARDAALEAIASTDQDTIEVYLTTYTLPDLVERLILMSDKENGNLTGNASDNYIEGNKRNDKLFGLSGNDILDGKAGADYMVGGWGDDTFYVDSKNDVVVETSNNGRDTVNVSFDYDLLKVAHIENAVLLGADNLTLQGNGENNLLKGNTGNNHLKGLGGNDWLEGGVGNDVLEGGNGNDVLNGNAGADRMIGGADNDVYYVDSKSDVVVETAGGGRDTVNVSFDYDLSKVAHIENAVLLGTGNLALQGSGEGNLLKGNAGNNHLKGLGGNDWLEGGAGNDILNGNAGADRMIGGAGDDVYYVDNKGDVVVETAGGRRDTVNVSFDYDLLKVAHIENAIAVGVGHIKLQGSGEGNLLKGNAGNNQLNGLGGNDGLDGGAGNDVLVGGSGRDVLVGGAGSDTFKFGSINDSTLALKDVIIDFNLIRGKDKIDLSAIDANTTQAGNQAFSFIGNTNFTAAGQVRFTGGVVSGDVNGDKVADFAIEVKNVTTLQASDFIL